MLRCAAMVGVFSLSKGNKIKNKTKQNFFWCVTLFFATDGLSLTIIVLCQQRPHIYDTNPMHFPQNSFLYDILCLFTFCPYWINVMESTWKCVTTVKNSFWVRIPLCANIQARKAALVRNCFSGRNHFHGDFLSLSHPAIFDQINTDVSNSGV